MRVAGTKAALEEQRDAISKLEGFPKPPSFVGKAMTHLVPKAYAPGAVGWTGHLVAVEKEMNPVDVVVGGEVIEVRQVEEPGDTYIIEIDDVVAARLDGARTSVKNKDVTVNLKPMTPRAKKPPIILTERPAGAVEESSNGKAPR